MNINDIVEGCELENAESRVRFSRWLKAVEKFFVNKNIVEALMDEKTLCKMFYAQSSGGLSRQKYQKNKKFIKMLQTFYNVPTFVPSRNKALMSRSVVSLYKSLDALLDFIDYVGIQSLKNYNKQDDLLNIKSMAILGWHGISLAQIVELRKDALENGIVCGIPIDAKFYRLISNLATSTKYRGLPGGRLLEYKSDDSYLFRSIVPNQLCNINHLSDSLKRFNRQAVLFSRKIEFSNLYKNARFISIAEDKSSNSLAKKIKDVFDCESKNVYGYKTEYLLWHKDIYLKKTTAH